METQDKPIYSEEELKKAEELAELFSKNKRHRFKTGLASDYQPVKFPTFVRHEK